MRSRRSRSEGDGEAPGRTRRVRSTRVRQPHGVLPRPKTPLELEASSSETLEGEFTVKSTKLRRPRRRPGGARQKIDYIGNVDITLDTTEKPFTVEFALQKKIHEDDWETWEEILEDVDGIDSGENNGQLTVTLTLGKYYSKRSQAGIRIAKEAAKALQLKVRGQVKVLRPDREERGSRRRGK